MRLPPLLCLLGVSTLLALVPLACINGDAKTGGDAGGGPGPITTGCRAGTLCGDGQCHDLTNDNANCGACSTAGESHACAAGQTCSAGSCSTACATGLVVCGASCVDPKTSLTHCGASGTCTGQSQGTACPAGQFCVEGACAAQCGSSAHSSLKVCGGICTDVSSDNANCGACGAACTVDGGNGTCANGKCNAVCLSGFGDCNGDPSDGCETNLLTSNNNCGGCGRVCTVGVCANGACPVDPNWAPAAPAADSPDPSHYLMLRGGTVFDSDAGPSDASAPPIVDAAALATGTDGAVVNAAACTDAGALVVNTSACAGSSLCDDVVFDKGTGLLWQRWPVAYAASAAQASCYCQNATIAGLQGWRLPTRLELVSIVDYGRDSPALHPIFSPSVPGSGSLKYLSATVSKPVEFAYTYQVDFTHGEADEWGGGVAPTTAARQPVRCVR